VGGGSGELLDKFSGYLAFVREAFPIEKFSRQTLDQSPELHGSIPDGARLHLFAPGLLFCLVAVPLDLLVQEGYCWVGGVCGSNVVSLLNEVE